MLYTYSITNQVAAVNDNLDFVINGVQTGVTATHSAGTPAISLNRSGYYLVHFNGVATTPDATGNVSIQLYVNDDIVNGALATATTAAVTDSENLSFTAIVKVLPNCCAIDSNLPSTLTFRNVGVAATFTSAAVTVTRLS